MATGDGAEGVRTGIVSRSGDVDLTDCLEGRRSQGDADASTNEGRQIAPPPFVARVFDQATVSSTSAEVDVEDELDPLAP